MNLDPELSFLLSALQDIPVLDPDSMSLDELRAAVVQPPVKYPTPVARVDEYNCQGSDGAIIPLRIYHPDGPGEHPLLVFFHGGGWVFGSIESHDELTRRLCIGAGAVVVSVDYRRAPETPFPGPLEDCYAATVWAADRAKELNADPARLAVGGDSAGGNLAAAVCLLARERQGPSIARQLLIYPATDTDFDTGSYRRFAKGPLLTRELMRWHWAQYLGSLDEDNPFAQPQRAELFGLPPATVLTAGHDPLHDEGKAYAERLAAAGVAVVYHDFPGMIHGFVSLVEALTEARNAISLLCEHLRNLPGSDQEIIGGRSSTSATSNFF